MCVCVKAGGHHPPTVTLLKLCASSETMAIKSSGLHSMLFNGANTNFSLRAVILKLNNILSHPRLQASAALWKFPASQCESWFVFPQCNAHLSWLLTDATCTTWVKVNVSSLIEKHRLGSITKRSVADFDLGPSRAQTAAPASLYREPRAQWCRWT